MVRWRIGVLASFVVLFFPIFAAAPGIPSIFGETPFNLGGAQCSISVKAGFQQMGVNFNLPIPPGALEVELYTTSTLDFKLQDAGVWIGGVEADIRRGQISAFLEMEANAGKNVRVLTSSEPFWAGQFPVEWKGSRLEWWAIDGGGGLDVAALTIVGGLRVEHLSLKLVGPVDTPVGLIQFFQARYGDRYRGDFLSKLWLPYVGIRTQGRCWKSTLRFSPIAWTDLKIPARYFYVASPTLRFFEEARYTFKRGGIWLDGSLDYDMIASSNFCCSLWFRASWLGIRGNGTEGYKLDQYLAGVSSTLFTDSNSASGMYTAYSFGGGLRAEYLFRSAASVKET